MQLEVMGAKVNVTLMGESGRGALLLHGWGCSAQMMEGAQRTLSAKMRTAAIDFPGHGCMGKAEAPPAAWGVPEYMDMTAEVIKQLDLAPCDVGAQSFGCRLAATYPELVGRLVLTGAAGVKKPADGKASAKQRVYKTLRGAMNAMEKTRLFGDLPNKGREALIQRFGSPDYRALTPEMRKTFNKVIALDLSDRLSEVKAPTILFFGENDTETPLWMGRVMEERIPDAALVTESGTGHFAYLERAEKFHRILISFLTEGR